MAKSPRTSTRKRAAKRVSAKKGRGTRTVAKKSALRTPTAKRGAKRSSSRAAPSLRPSRRELEIRKRSLSDSKFREALIARPMQTLEREFGITAPAGWNVYVHEEGPGEIHVVIPKLPQDAARGFGEVEAPDGGTGRTSCCTCGTSTAQSFSSLQAGCGCRAGPRRRPL